MKIRSIGFALLLTAALTLPAAVFGFGWVANMEGIQEVPPNASPATGTWTGTLNASGTSLSYQATWGPLIGSYTASHIHGPAPVGVNAGVLHGLVGAGPTGTPGGSWALTATNVSQLYNRLLYVNAHSSAFPGGEIRGQIYCDPGVAEFDANTDTGLSQCIQLCDSTSSYIRITNIPPGQYPVVTKRLGCFSVTNPCDVDCYPSEYITEFFQGFWYPDDGGWHWNWNSTTFWLEVRGNGCICVTFDGVLSVQMGAFDAIAGDGQVTLNWNTQSETRNDRFEIERNDELVAVLDANGSATNGAAYTWTDRNVVNGTSYEYSLYSVELGGERVRVASGSAIPNVGAAVIDGYALDQNFPNPFNPETNIQFTLLDAGTVKLAVYDLMGRLVTTLVDRTMPRGEYTVNFNAAGLSTGLYVYRIDVNGFSAQKKMLLLK